MTRTLIFALGALCLAVVVSAADLGLPTLHTIYPYTFSSVYGCNGASYQNSALFLSSYSKSNNVPELLYTGACGSQSTFVSSTAGDDFSVLAFVHVSLLVCSLSLTLDESFCSVLPDIPLKNVTAAAALSSGQAFYTDVDVVAGATYSALLSKSNIRYAVSFHE